MQNKFCLKIFAIVFLITLFLPLTAVSAQDVSAPTNQSLPSNPEYVPGELLIKYKNTAPSEDEIVQKYKFRSAKKVFRDQQIKKIEDKAEEIISNAFDREGLDKLYLAKSDEQDVNKLIEQVKKDPEVEYAEPNYILRAYEIPNDPSFSKLWGFDNTGQTGGVADADIDAPEAWDREYGTGPVVGIIDSGIDYNHEDLKANIWTNSTEANGQNGVDDDRNGYIDDIHGYDFANDDPDPMDDNGHGTHVAGTIAAVGENGIGVSGVNYHGKVAALKFLSASGGGTTDAAIRAIQYANLMGFKITNNSWGGGGYSQALYNAISAANQAGNLFIAASGNSGSNNDNRPSYPDSFNLPNIISVAATDKSDKLATFSNYGATTVDIGAPGVSIYSTVPKGNCSICNSSGYATLSGTSMATPHVSGAAAYIWAAFPSVSHHEIKNKLLNQSDSVTSLSGKTVSGKRLNVNNPLGSTIPPTTPSPTKIPTPTPTSGLTPTPTSKPTPTLTPTISPTPTSVQPSNSITATNISMRFTIASSVYRYIYTTVTIKNKNTNAPISSANVSIKLKQPSGRISNLYGRTNSNGEVTLKALSREKGTYTSNVTNVSKTGYQYTPTITSASLVVN